MIKIGGKDLKTNRPANLDEQLVAATGCFSKEIDTILAAGAGHAAAALRPFIGKDDFPGLELNRAIAADPSAVASIRDLYATSGAEKAPEKPEGK